MLKDDIGINAGVIWRLLSAKGALSIREIEAYTNFRDTYIYYSLGWLAREGKIRFFEKGDSVLVELSRSYSGYNEMYF